MPLGLFVRSTEGGHILKFCLLMVFEDNNVINISIDYCEFRTAVPKYWNSYIGTSCTYLRAASHTYQHYGFQNLNLCYNEESKHYRDWCLALSLMNTATLFQNVNWHWKNARSFWCRSMKIHIEHQFHFHPNGCYISHTPAHVYSVFPFEIASYNHGAGVT